MGSTQTIATSIAQQAMQMEHPSREAIWSRAVEIFDGEEFAREWMNNPLPILDHNTPQQYADSGDAEKQRQVLTSSTARTVRLPCRHAALLCATAFLRDEESNTIAFRRMAERRRFPRLKGVFRWPEAHGTA